MLRRLLLLLICAGLWVIFANVPPTAEATYNPSVIKSIQHGSITQTDGGNLENTATINAVVVANAIVIHTGQTVDTVDVGLAGGSYVVLTNATTVTAVRQQTSGLNAVKFDVVEFRNGVIKSNQPYAVNVGSGATFTLSPAVTVAKTALFFGGFSYSSTTNKHSADIFINSVLTNSTTVTFTRSGTTGTYVFAGTALEFK